LGAWRRGRDYLGDSDRAGKIRSVVAIKDNPVNKIQVFKTREKVGDRIDRLGLSVLRDLGGDGNINGSDLSARWHSTKHSGAVTLQPLSTRPVVTWR
jgi:hypothetical protein